MGLFSYFGRLLTGSTAIADKDGSQQAFPSVPLTDNLKPMSPEVALQVGTVYACVDLIASTVASLPLFVYRNRAGKRTLARDSSLWFLLHDSPNAHMTAMEFWRSMLMQLELRGNAFALIDRDASGEAVSMYPLASDQIEVVRKGSELVYTYTKDNVKHVYGADRILHLKGLGNGVIGISKLDYMRASTTESLHAQETANNLFGNANKPAGVLTVEHVLNREQREQIKQQFATMRSGQASGLFVLEADMKYSQLTLTPAETQLLETRKYGVAEIARWFGVPPVLISGDSTTTWGSGIEQIIEGFYRFTIRPLVVSIEQSISKNVMTAAQRQRFTAEFSLDALLRSSEAQRFEIYAKATQNGLMTRNEVRQLENMPPISGGDDLTVLTNLIRLSDLGNKVNPVGRPSSEGEIGDITNETVAQ